MHCQRKCECHFGFGARCLIYDAWIFIDSLRFIHITCASQWIFVEQILDICMTINEYITQNEILTISFAIDILLNPTFEHTKQRFIIQFIGLKKKSLDQTIRATFIVHTLITF